MTARQALALVRRHGVMLEAARGPVPNLADAIAKRSLRGSWWTDPRSREIFAITRAVRDSSDVAVMQLIDGRITYVHRRLWPALTRLGARLPKRSVARVREVHTAKGAHRLVRVAFPRWIPAEVLKKANALSDERAIEALGDWIESLFRSRTLDRRR